MKKSKLVISLLLSVLMISSVCVVTNTSAFAKISDLGNHQNIEIRNAKEATCTEDGYTGDTWCLDCNKMIKQGEIVKATGHIIVVDNAVDSTYLTPGLTEGSHCSTCGEIIIKQEELPVLTETPGWHLFDNGWCLFDNDGIIKSNCWTTDSKGWCYLGSDGYMLTDSWVMDSTGWCYVDSTGHMAVNRWVSDSKGWCYLDENGRMSRNTWVMDSYDWCYLNSFGYASTNAWVADSEYRIYLDQYGHPTENMEFNGMLGVDISQHNGTIDWDILKDSVDFVILRIGWTGNYNNHTIDIKFEQYYEEATRVGLPIGVYVYLYNNNEESAKDGAKWAVKQLAGKTIQMPFYADMEDKTINDLGMEKLTSITNAFNSVVEENGYTAGVYANKTWFDNYLSPSIQTRYTCWIAHYTNGDNKYKDSFDMWQNGSDGNVAGINGRVDTNCLYNESLVILGNGWNIDNYGWYLVQDGKKVKNQWAMDSVGWCYLDNTGYIVTNCWRADSHGWCYLDEYGRMVTSRWVTDYLDWCYVDENGYMVTDRWILDSQGWCYLDSTGHILRNGEAYDSTGKHHLDSTGHMDW